MGTIKIGVVEDEIIIADRICSTLQKLGYDVAGPVISYSQAVALLETDKPDLLLLDIQLSGQKDGIELAQLVKEKYSIPFIFLTANSDGPTIERAKKVQPYAFLVKPYTSESLFAAIEIALASFNQRNAETKNIPVKPLVPQWQEYIFIKNGNVFHKMAFGDILFIESDENYVTVHALDKRKLMTRSTFQDFIGQFDATQLVRVHRRYAVNPAYISSIETSQLILANDNKIPINKTERDNLMKLFGLPS